MIREFPPRVSTSADWYYLARFAAALGLLSAGGCAIYPDIPPDWALPVREIILHTACELRFSLIDLQPISDPKHFDPTAWTIKVTLNPKADADISPGAGLTRRFPQTGGTTFSNLLIGPGNGVTTEMKGSHYGTVDFRFDSGALMNDAGLPCETATPSYHTLTKGLGIHDWLPLRFGRKRCSPLAMAQGLPPGGRDGRGPIDGGKNESDFTIRTAAPVPS